MKRVFCSTTLVFLLVSNVLADREAPEEVPPIATDEAVFSVPHFPEGARIQNGGVVDAHHPETKKLLWRIQVYRTVYDESLERDIQDVFIKSLSFDKTHSLLILSDERGRIFVLNLKTKKVTEIAESEKSGEPSAQIASKPSLEIAREDLRKMGVDPNEKEVARRDGVDPKTYFKGRPNDQFWNDGRKQVGVGAVDLITFTEKKLAPGGIHQYFFKAGSNELLWVYRGR